MATVRVEQRNAHLAGNVRLEFVKGREGQIAKATLTAISNNRRGSGDERAEESTAIQWTLWGKQAENAAEYLGKGSHVNIVGRLRNNNYQDADGEDVYGLGFTCEEIDYLDSKAESEARRARDAGVDAGTAGEPQSAPASRPRKANGRGRKAALLEGEAQQAAL
jgi:single-strand DNA-binding protein